MTEELAFNKVIIYFLIFTLKKTKLNFWCLCAVKKLARCFFNFWSLQNIKAVFECIRISKNQIHFWKIYWKKKLYVFAAFLGCKKWDLYFLLFQIANKIDVSLLFQLAKKFIHAFLRKNPSFCGNLINARNKK